MSVDRRGVGLASTVVAISGKNEEDLVGHVNDFGLSSGSWVLVVAVVRIVSEKILSVRRKSSTLETLVVCSSGVWVPGVVGLVNWRRIGIERLLVVSVRNNCIWRQSEVDQSSVGVELVQARAVLVGNPEAVVDVTLNQSKSLRVQANVGSGFSRVEICSKAVSNKSRGRQSVAVLLESGVAIQTSHEVSVEIFQQNGVLVVPDQILRGRTVQWGELGTVLMDSRNKVQSTIGVPSSIRKIVGNEAVDSVGNGQRRLLQSNRGTKRNGVFVLINGVTGSKTIPN
ncbi:hypothetical protein OGAPHI_006880 [Ogataea philodendri]|uniref:Uncharacterized protein n=1 Tax=Ogataea philodendri TaxID=1378263 RepID=A0A9P8NVP0_9ASCO|nr:uncharacterized protein OGAPHI_006880 [Ogataea philodendri]KAH3660294.1 hypothetical protein OGAPHI_006880 [Ogataea philodendri]